VATFAADIIIGPACAYPHEVLAHLYHNLPNNAAVCVASKGRLWGMGKGSSLFGKSPALPA